MDNPIAPIAKQCPTQVQEWCKAARIETSGLFVLINPTSETLPERIRRMANHSGINLFTARTTNEGALAVGPRLVDLQSRLDPDKVLLPAFEQQDPERPWGTLISSPLPLQAVADRLRRRIDVKAAGRDLMLRSWDSRILLSLHRVVAEATHRPLFAFGVRALVSDRCGDFVDISLSCPPRDPVELDGLILTREDLAALGRESRADAMLGMLRQSNQTALDAITPGGRHPLAEQQLAECRQRGLESPRDQALALSLAIEHGLCWWEDEFWQPIVEQSRSCTLLKAYMNHLETT